MKKTISFLLCSIMLIASISFSYANDNKELNPIFQDFISNSVISEIEIIDNFGNTIDNKNSDKIKMTLLSKDYKKVAKLLSKHNLSLSYEDKQAVTNEITPMNIGLDVNFTRHVYHIKTDLSGSVTKEWLTTLRGTYRENPDGTFTAYGSPSMTINTDTFGSAYDVMISNISTGFNYQHNNRGINYYGSYTLRARLVFPISIGGFTFPIGRIFDWGYIYANHIVN